MSKFNTVEFEFNILVGLPGSGKTYWANQNYVPYHLFKLQNGKILVSLDDYLNKGDDMIPAAFEQEFKLYMKNYRMSKINVCIDGPITTYKHLYRVINDVLNYIKKNLKWKEYHKNVPGYGFSFIIHQWNEDRETCLYNDMHRNRKIKATSAIKNFEYDKIDVNEVDKWLKTTYIDINILKVKKIDHMVSKTTTYNQLFEPACDNHYCGAPLEKGNYMFSESWSLGGEGGNCWGDHWNISSEKPIEFVELDDFLEKIAPNITFLQYKKIKNHCVDIIDWHNSDYYSSGSDDACWRCDMHKLYELLKEMNYIED